MTQQFTHPIMYMCIVNLVFAQSAICGESLTCINKKPRTGGQIRYRCWIHSQFVQLICTICKATGFEKKGSIHKVTLSDHIISRSRLFSKCRICAKNEYCCYVMRSSKLSLNSLYAPDPGLYYAQIPIKIEHMVPEI